MRAVALHADVLVATSAVLRANCVIVRGAVSHEREAVVSQAGEAVVSQAGEAVVPQEREAVASEQAGETFVIDSPVLPDELDALGPLLIQAQFPDPSGLLATHGDWDHLLGRLAFPGLALGCAESTALRLKDSPGEAQRDLRSFDEHLLIERDRPLALGAVQPLSVPGHCAVGDRELEVYAAGGHTLDGMAILIPWTGVLVVGDYLSTVELPILGEGGGLDAYLATLERLHPLVANAEQVVPGHGPVLEGARALELLEEDAAYLRALHDAGADAELPSGRRGAGHRSQHAQNVTALAAA